MTITVHLINNKLTPKIPGGIYSVASLIDRWQWAILLLSSPFFLLSGTWNFLILLIVPFLWVISMLAGKNPVPITPLNVSILIFAIMMLVSLYATNDLSVSLPNLSNMVLSIGIFFMIVKMSRKSSLWMYSLIGFLVAGIGLGGLSLVATGWFLNKFPLISELAGLVEKITASLRGDSRTFHPNVIAGTFLWFIPIYLSVSAYALIHIHTLMSWIGKWKTTFLVGAILASTIISGGVLILTQSRSAYLGLFITILALPLFLIKKNSFRLIYTLAIAVGITNIVFWGGKTIENVANLNQTGLTGLSLNSLQGRLELWSRAITMIKDFPLTGVGMGGFKFIIPTLYPLFSISPDVIIPHAHNEFLVVAGELGIPGLISFIAVYICCFSMTMDTLNKLTQLNLKNPFRQKEWLFFRFAIFGLACGLMAHMFYGFADAVFLAAKPSFIFWVVIGLITSLFLRVNEEISLLDPHPS